MHSCNINILIKCDYCFAGCKQAKKHRPIGPTTLTYVLTVSPPTPSQVSSLIWGTCSSLLSCVLFVIFVHTHRAESIAVHTHHTKVSSRSPLLFCLYEKNNMATCGLHGCGRPCFQRAGVVHDFCGRSHAKAALGERLAPPHGICHVRTRSKGICFSKLKYSTREGEISLFTIIHCPTAPDTNVLLYAAVRAVRRSAGERSQSRGW